MAKFLVFLFVFVNSNLITAAAADSEEKPAAYLSRKLGKNFTALSRLQRAAEPPRAAENAADGPSTDAAQEQVMIINHRKRSGVDRSIAGGGVILGGLATTFLVAVFCYIRATGRKNAEPTSPTYSSDARTNNTSSSNSPAICSQV